MNWWTIISQTLTFFRVVTGSSPYTLSARTCISCQQIAVGEGRCMTFRWAELLRSCRCHAQDEI